MALALGPAIGRVGSGVTIYELDTRDTSVTIPIDRPTLVTVIPTSSSAVGITLNGTLTLSIVTSEPVVASVSKAFATVYVAPL